MGSMPATGAGVNFDLIPAYIKPRKQFVLWRYENRGGKKPTKPPCQPNGNYASTTKPTTWNDLETCKKALAVPDKKAQMKGGFHGTGFVFAEGDKLTGIDLDNCLDENGQPEQWAQEILDRFAETYIEISPSGIGFHILCFGKPLATGQRKWKKKNTNEDQGIEVYDYTSPRYFTITGNRINSNEIN
jgi:putative DNA primase/helicase